MGLQSQRKKLGSFRLAEEITFDALIDSQKILLSPLHIKLGIMKQFVKALDRTNPCFQYIHQQFPLVSEAKAREALSTVHRFANIILSLEICYLWK